METTLPKRYQSLPCKARRKILRLLERFEAIPKKCSKTERKIRDRLKNRIHTFNQKYAV